MMSYAARLNPLHCGAVVASWTKWISALSIYRVSIPFIAGQWSLHGAPVGRRSVLIESQSPSLRGSGRFSGGAESRRAAMRVSIPFIAGQWSLLYRLRT